ncbi:MAG: HU family DNA-binding protein [Pseudomonadota bacterium]
MNKQELSEKVHAAYDKLGKGESAKLVDDLFEIIITTLLNGEEVKISGFGTFVVKQTAARKGINPKTKEQIMIPSKKAVKFRASKPLKDRLAK